VVTRIMHIAAAVWCIVLSQVCAFSRPKEDLLPGLENVTLWDDSTSAFQLPSLQQLTANRIRVVVVTALMAAKVRWLLHSWDHLAPSSEPVDMS
jgi:hypothetical protein